MTHTLKPLAQVSRPPRNLVIGLVASLCFLLFGYGQGLMGTLLTFPSFIQTFPRIDTLNHPNDSRYSTLQGLTMGSFNLGGFAGGILASCIGDHLGRRTMTCVGCSVVIVGAAFQCSAFSLSQLIVGRIVAGVGNGITTSTVPVWASETSNSRHRGRMVVIQGTMCTGGICLSYWIDLAFSYLEPSTVSWRCPIAVQIILALFIVLFISQLPESPRWLVLRGRSDEAFNVMCELSGCSDEDSHLELQRISEIEDSLSQMKALKWTSIFNIGRGRDRVFHRVTLAYLSQVLQQFSGINLITFYAATIFQQRIGLNASTSRLLTAANGTEYFAASLIAVYTIDKFGRRRHMMFGSLGMAGSMAVLAAMNYMSEKNISGISPGIASAVFLFVFNTFFAIGWAGTTWVYCAEIVPLLFRATSNGISTAANWLTNFVIVMITPVCFSSIGYQTYIIFAIVNAFIVPVVYLLYPETAGRSLEEIDTIFHEVDGWFSAVAAEKRKPLQSNARHDALDVLSEAAYGTSSPHVGGGNWNSDAEKKEEFET